MRKKGLRSTIAYLGLSLCLCGGLITYTGPAKQQADQTFAGHVYEDVVEGPEMVVQIEGEDVPLAKISVSSKTTTKTTTKKEQMDKPATKTSKTSKTNTKTTTRTSKAPSKTTVEDTTVETTVVTSTVKKSKVKTIKTTVKTTVKTQIIPVATKVTSNKVNSITDIQGKINPKVYEAFNKLEFKFMIDSKIRSTGVFSVTNHWIKLKVGNADYLMHELGHFVGALEKNADQTKEWNNIYQAEKGRYTGSNKTYITSTQEEYFAESFRDYSADAKGLKAKRPRTYAYMDKVVKGINVEKDTKWFYWMYGAVWPEPIYF